MMLPDSSNFGTLLGYFSFINWLAYGAAFSAIVWLRIRKPETKRPFKVKRVLSTRVGREGGERVSVKMEGGRGKRA